MSASHPHGHNGTGLSLEEQRKLWDHVRAREVLNEQQDEIRLDIKMRKELIKEDGFDNNIVEAILKRRKNGEGETRAADNLLRMYEEALIEQGALPLEQTRQPRTPDRRPVEDIAHDLHGEALPPMPEKVDADVREAAERLDKLARDAGGTITVSGAGGSMTFGAERPALFDD